MTIGFRLELLHLKHGRKQLCFNMGITLLGLFSLINPNNTGWFLGQHFFTGCWVQYSQILPTKPLGTPLKWRVGGGGHCFVLNSVWICLDFIFFCAAAAPHYQTLVPASLFGFIKASIKGSGQPFFVWIVKNGDGYHHPLYDVHKLRMWSFDFLQFA